MPGRAPTVWLLVAGALVTYGIMAATHMTTATPLEQSAWIVLGTLLAGLLLWSVRVYRALRTAETQTQRAVAQWHDAQTNAARYRVELEELRKRHLGDLADAVQTLLVTLQERGQELDEEENWWKRGGRVDE
jgi:hypothetical protein